MLWDTQFEEYTFSVLVIEVSGYGKLLECVAEMEAILVQEQQEMQRQKIIQCLKQLGEELEVLQIQQPIRILMIGGAFMITQIGNREQTRDVDVLVYLERNTEEYRKLRSAATFVAVDMQIDYQWFSDGIGDLLQAAGKVPPGQLWLKHGMLEVYIPEPQYILALKFLAGGRGKDIGDLQTLCQMFKMKHRNQVEKLLKQYFSKEALEVYAPDINKTFEALHFK